MADKHKSTPLALAFEGHPITAVEYDGEPVVLAGELARALGYEDASQLAVNIGRRWSAEFVEGKDYHKLTNGRLAAFKAIVSNYMPDRQVVDDRAPSVVLVTESGAQLAAMLSRTPRGRAFRRWVVDEMIPAWRRARAGLPVEALAVDAAPPAPPVEPPALPRPSRAAADRAELRLRRALAAITEHGMRLSPAGQEALAAELARMAQAGDALVGADHENDLALWRLMGAAAGSRAMAAMLRGNVSLELDEADRLAGSPGEAAFRAAVRELAQAGLEGDVRGATAEALAAAARLRQSAAAARPRRLPGPVPR